MYVITEYDEIIDVCTTEENAIKAKAYWIKEKLKGNSHCSEYNLEEANEAIGYVEYTPDTNLLEDKK